MGVDGMDGVELVGEARGVVHFQVGVGYQEWRLMVLELERAF
jgi:hypothetical protein